MKKNFLKAIELMLTITVLAGLAPAAPAQAAKKAKKPKAKKELTVEIARPKMDITRTEGVNKAFTHKVGITVQLKVKYGGKDVTRKVKYKIPKHAKKLQSINKKGKVRVKKKGSVIISITYKGARTQSNLIGGTRHDWQPVKEARLYHASGKYCATCKKTMSYAEMKDHLAHVHGIFVDKVEWSPVDPVAYEHEHTHEKVFVSGRSYLLDVEYVSRYECRCGRKKAGMAAPKDYLQKEEYEAMGCTVKVHEGPVTRQD